jgi:hypothetical protein
MKRSEPGELPGSLLLMCMIQEGVIPLPGICQKSRQAVGSRPADSSFLDANDRVADHRGLDRSDHR